MSAAAGDSSGLPVTSSQVAIGGYMTDQSSLRWLLAVELSDASSPL